MEYEPDFFGSKRYDTGSTIVSFAGGELPMTFTALEAFADDPRNDLSVACVFGGGRNFNPDDPVEDGQHSFQFKARYLGTDKRIGHTRNVDSSHCSICSYWNEWMSRQPDSKKLVRWTQCRWTTQCQRTAVRCFAASGPSPKKGPCPTT